MSFPSVQPFPYDRSKPVTQQFCLEYHGKTLGTVHAHKVRNPSVNSVRDPDLYRISYHDCDRGLRESLADAVARWLNGNSRRFRQQLLGSEEQVTASSQALKHHLETNVLFLSNPQIDEPVRITYIPRGTAYPYASRRYSLTGFISKLGIISSIR